MLAVAPIWLSMDGSSNVSRAPRVGHKKSRKGCAQCKRRHVKVGFHPWLYASTLPLRKGRVRLTSIRIRSVMKNPRARIAHDIALRVRLLVDRTCPETMQKRSNNAVQLHQYRATRQEHHHTTSSAYIQLLPQQHQEHRQYAVRVPQIRQATIQYRSSPAPSTATQRLRIKPGFWTLSSCITSRHSTVKS